MTWWTSKWTFLQQTLTSYPAVHARRPIHCYRPNNVHHIHSLPLLLSRCALLHYIVLTALCRSTDLQGFCMSVTKYISCCHVFPLSAENKRRSKHAGKSLNPEWNQTVIYKNILLEQVCGHTHISNRHSYTRCQCHRHFDVVKGTHRVVLHPESCHVNIMLISFSILSNSTIFRVKM